MEDYHVSSLHVDGIVFTAAILNFCVKRKKVFISETEQDRAILTKFLLTASKQQALASL